MQILLNLLLKIVQLHSGDVVVLYTDGITEAENMDQVLYGLERLIEVVQINWQRTATKSGTL